MNLVWVFGFCAFAMALHTTKDTKQTKGPSTPPAAAGSARDDKSKANTDSSPAVRHDKNNNKGIAPRLPLASLDVARGDDSKKSALLGMTPSGEMAANRVRHTYVQTIQASPDRVFAVIEPVAEVEWAPGFEYRWLYARDGEHARSGQEGDVFVTNHHSGLGSQGTAVWVISRRDAKERRVQFVRFIADYQVTQIDVHVIPSEKHSKCEVTYTYTALSEHGREALKHITKEHYEAQMKEWEEQVNAYLSRR